MDVSLDASVIGSMNGYTNEDGSHKVLSAATFVVNGIATGNHTTTLQRRPSR